MSTEISNLLFCMVIMVMSLAFHTASAKPPVNQSEPSMTDNNTPGEDEQLLAVLALDPEPGPEYFASSPDGLIKPGGNASLSAENASSPAYDGAFAPQPPGDEFLSPEYPSPAPEIADDNEFSPQYSSPTPYVDNMAPEIADDDEYYSSTPTPTPATTVDSSSSQLPNYAPVATPVSTTPDVDYGNVAPTPRSNVLPFTYEAEDEVSETDEGLQGEFSHEKKGTVLGFVIFAVCLVGLGGFVYKKKKNDMRKSQYEYLGKRELEL
ncbi:hypothetical protein FEM48_Zijuj12G0172000 [Ziziphus jujuba var. spinosa]|uniref:Uncharacterized protein n=1 Tax=Ziziphus jujuba var. spinosa TaxID=714518 RepID=A0A978UEL5_ZIZJJ|nr:hypothetical protein FEM48_Zijuj12G0172000 [Ziziphus jujuba var. spinosa]